MVRNLRVGGLFLFFASFPWPERGSQKSRRNPACTGPHVAPGPCPRLVHPGPWLAGSGVPDRALSLWVPRGLTLLCGLWPLGGVPSRAPRLCLCPRDAPGLCPGHPRSRQRPAPSAPTLTADDHTRPGRPAQPRPLLSGHLPRPLLPGTSPLTQNRTRSANHHLQRPLVPLRLIVMSPSPHRAHWAPAQAGPWGPGLECPSTALLHPQQPGAGEDPPAGTWATR